MSAKFHSFDNGIRDMFYENAGQASHYGKPIYGLSGILKTKEVYHLYNMGESFGSGKFGIIKLVQKKNYDKI